MSASCPVPRRDARQNAEVHPRFTPEADVEAHRHALTQLNAKANAGAMVVGPLRPGQARRTLILFVLTWSLVVGAEARLDGNTVVVDLGTQQLRFFAGCTAVSVIHATQLHVGCGDGRVRSYELDESSALLVNERQFDGRDARVMREAGDVLVRVVRADGSSSTSSLEAAPAPLPGETRLKLTEARVVPGPSTAGAGVGQVVGRVALEVLVESLLLGSGVGLGLLIALPIAESAGRCLSCTGLGVMLEVPLVVATLAGVLSPLVLTPLHRALGGRGRLWQGFVALVPSLLAALVTVGVSGADLYRGPLLGVVALPGFASIVGLEVGHAVVGPTLSVSSSGASVGVTGRF